LVKVSSKLKSLSDYQGNLRIYGGGEETSSLSLLSSKLTSNETVPVEKEQLDLLTEYNKKTKEDPFNVASWISLVEAQEIFYKHNQNLNREAGTVLKAKDTSLLTSRDIKNIVFLCALYTYLYLLVTPFTAKLNYVIVIYIFIRLR
jgi:hypothetical protein